MQRLITAAASGRGPRVSINPVSINIPSLCIYILRTKHKVIFCQQQQTTDHPFNDCSFILRSIEAPVVTLRHANEADCDNERWLVTTHRMPGVTPGTGRCHMGPASERRAEESVGQWRQDRALQARRCQSYRGCGGTAMFNPVFTASSLFDKIRENLSRVLANWQ